VGVWPLTWVQEARGPGVQINSKYSNFNSNAPKLDLIQIELSRLKNFQIKYGWKVFEIRNNFPYKDFLIFEMDFELKFREASMSWKQGKIDWNFLGTRVLMKPDQQPPFHALLQGKINS
jgi:hypothetical protein